MLENVNKYGVVEVSVEEEGVVGQIVKQGNEWRYMLKVGKDMSYCSKQDFMENLEGKWEDLWMEGEEEDIAEISEDMGLVELEELGDEAIEEIMYEEEEEDMVDGTDVDGTDEDGTDVDGTDEIEEE